jgi:hypothetical protein
MMDSDDDAVLWLHGLTNSHFLFLYPFGTLRPVASSPEIKLAISGSDSHVSEYAVRSMDGDITVVKLIELLFKESTASLKKGHGRVSWRCISLFGVGALVSQVCFFCTHHESLLIAFYPPHSHDWTKSVPNCC